MTEDLTLEDVQQASDGAAEAAIADLLALEIPVFYIENNINVLEQANGQRFEIEYARLARGAYKIVRELPAV